MDVALCLMLLRCSIYTAQLDSGEPSISVSVEALLTSQVHSTYIRKTHKQANTFELLTRERLSLALWFIATADGACAYNVCGR